MTLKLKQDIRWFEDEIALCERVIRELEAAGAPVAKISDLRANLASHRQTLGELLGQPAEVFA